MELDQRDESGTVVYPCYGSSGVHHIGTTGRSTLYMSGPWLSPVSPPGAAPTHGGPPSPKPITVQGRPRR
jgi:hypothetical protein